MTEKRLKRMLPGTFRIIIGREYHEKPIRTSVFQKIYVKVFDWLQHIFAGSVVGIIMEGTFCLLTKGQWESHVVSVCLPFNALYGAGAALFYVGAVKLRKKNIWIRVPYMTIAATVLELLCGLLLKHGLGMRAWSYENSFLNYKGMICLGFSLVWGFAAFGFCKLYSPHINALLNKLKGRYWNCACTVLSIVMVIDISLAGISICLLRNFRALWISS